MPQDRRKSPGSFQDELGGVIERIAPSNPKAPAKPEKTEKPAKKTAELSDRLFWRSPDEKA